MDFPERLERPDFIQPEIVEETAESDGRKNPAHDTQSDPSPSASWGFSAFRHHGPTVHLGEAVGNTNWLSACDCRSGFFASPLMNRPGLSS
jgi:hypothetical protein